MATTITIAQQNYAVGTYTEGPSSIPSGYSQALLVIDRTAGTKSLNSQPVTTTLDLAVSETTDGGATWFPICTAHAVGGTYTDNETNTTITQTTIQCPLPFPDLTNRQAKATITVGGATVSFSGSLTLS